MNITAAGEGAELLRFSTERPWVLRQVYTGPSAGLELFSTIGQKRFQITSSDGSNVATFFADGPNSKVGIGTINPTAPLEVLTPEGYAVVGRATAASNSESVGVAGYSEGAAGRGVYGSAKYLGSGVYGEGTGAYGWGVYALGRSGASGTKLFRIDHPLDPKDKYLLHYSMEMPEPQNAYNGVVTTDREGKAWVQLPAYFAEINKHPRYQLTVVDDGEGPGFVQVKVGRKIRDNRFMIMTSAPRVEVCWEVKATRNDLWVRNNGAPAEEVKVGAERGKYQHPELYDAPAEMGVMRKAQPLKR